MIGPEVSERMDPLTFLDWFLYAALAIAAIPVGIFCAYAIAGAIGIIVAITAFVVAYAAYCVVAVWERITR